MDRAGIREHWDDWAKRYGRELRATTKAGTAKRLEIDALVRSLRRFGNPDREGVTLLEAGCGNAHNCLALAEAFPALSLTGFDYSDPMIERARENVADAGLQDRIALAVGDVLDLDALDLLPAYDVVVTDRCLINLPELALQQQALEGLAARVTPGGLLLMIENCQAPYGRQNDLREAAGLPRRTPAAFNLFLDEDAILPVFDRYFERLAIDDFAALHDFVLYVLLPKVGEGAVDYESPLVEAATQLSIALPEEARRELPGWGQLRLFVGRRR